MPFSRKAPKRPAALPLDADLPEAACATAGASPALECGGTTPLFFGGPGPRVVGKDEPWTGAQDGGPSGRCEPGSPNGNVAISVDACSGISIASEAHPATGGNRGMRSTAPGSSPRAFNSARPTRPPSFPPGTTPSPSKPSATGRSPSGGSRSTSAFPGRRPCATSSRRPPMGTKFKLLLLDAHVERQRTRGYNRLAE